jgi:hypothetical protein
MTLVAPGTPLRPALGGREATSWSPWGAFRRGAEDHGRGDDAADAAEGL